MKFMNKIFRFLLRKSFIISIIIVVLLIFIGFTTIHYINSDTIEGKLTDKYQKRVSESEDYFYIVIKDKNKKYHVISNNDLYLKGKFNSADIQGRLTVDKNYQVTTTGYRIPLFNEYPILNQIKETK